MKNEICVRADFVLKDIETKYSIFNKSSGTDCSNLVYIYIYIYIYIFIYLFIKHAPLQWRNTTCFIVLLL